MNITKYVLQAIKWEENGDVLYVKLDNHARIEYYADTDEFALKICNKLDMDIHTMILEEDFLVYYLDYYGRLD